MERDVVVEVRKCNTVLGANRLANNDLVDVVEFVPVFVSVCNRFARVIIHYNNMAAEHCVILIIIKIITITTFQTAMEVHSPDSL